MQQNEDDNRWKWLLEPNYSYSFRSLGRLIDNIALPLVEPKTEWIRWAHSKANIHLWRTLCNRLSTEANLIKRGVGLQSDVCKLCNSQAETLDYVMAQCSTTKVVTTLLPRWVERWPINAASADEIWTEICKIAGDN